MAATVSTGDSRPRIGIDLDGCVFDWDQAAISCLRSRGCHVRTDFVATQWKALEAEIGSCWWDWLWTEGVERYGLFEGFCRPYEGALHSLTRLAKTFDVVILTARPANARAATLRSLADYDIPVNEIHFVEHMADKAAIECDVYVEDSPHGLRALIDARGAERVIAMARPWNDECAGEVRYRTPFWSEVVSTANWIVASDKANDEYVQRLDQQLVDEFVSMNAQQVKSHADVMRTFDSGATRDTDADKLDYEGFIAPVALERFAQYMHRHRVQSDGSLRPADNWQLGIPREAYMSSMWRHFMDVWCHQRGNAGLAIEEDFEEALCALAFNVNGMLFELLSGR